VAPLAEGLEVGHDGHRRHRRDRVRGSADLGADPERWKATVKGPDCDLEIDRLWQKVLDYMGKFLVRGSKVRIIQVTAACYSGSDCVAYLKRALKWIEQHPEEGL